MPKKIFKRVCPITKLEFEAKTNSVYHPSIRWMLSCDIKLDTLAQIYPDNSILLERIKKRDERIEQYRLSGKHAEYQQRWFENLSEERKKEFLAKKREYAKNYVNPNKESLRKAQKKYRDKNKELAKEFLKTQGGLK